MTTTHFDRWAPRYDRSILQRFMFEPVHRAVLDAFGENGKPPGDVLDVGCGTGRLLERAARRWPTARLTGVDVSAPMIAEASRKHDGDERFAFRQGSASALPLEDQSVDAAFSTLSFHHWDDQQAGLGEVARVLRPGALFVLADVDAPLLSFIGHILHRIDGSRMRSSADVDRMLAQAGFSVLVHRRIRTISRTQLAVGRNRSAP